MKKIFLFFILITISSCAIIMDAADLNTSGVVSSAKPLVNRKEGDMEYLLKVNPEEKIYIRLVTFGRFNIGDTIFFSTQIYRLAR